MSEKHDSTKVRKVKQPTSGYLTAIRNVLEYRAGKLFWKSSFGRAARAGKEAGVETVHGYVAINIFYRIHYAHQIVWFLVNGKWPVMQIDHIDRNKRNNDISNLRLVTTRQNSINNNKPAGITGARGVCKTENGRRYVVYICVNTKTKYLGRFDTIEDAVEARKRAEEKYNGVFAGAL